jgi:hypothetical protein
VAIEQVDAPTLEWYLEHIWTKPFDEWVDDD